jgi:hypothetical protein
VSDSIHQKFCLIEDHPMPTKFDAEEFAVALRQIRPVKSVSPANPASSTPVTRDDSQQSEELRLRVITARTKLKLMRDRSDALQDSLQRFLAQQRSANRA